MLNRKDLIFEVGIKAYELYTGEKYNYGMEVYPNEYSTGAYVKHIPTGIEVYNNSERSQIKNRDMVLKRLEKYYKLVSELYKTQKDGSSTLKVKNTYSYKNIISK